MSVDSLLPPFIYTSVNKIPDTTLQGPQPRHRQPSRSPGHSSSSSSGGSSTSLELNSSEYGRSRGCGSPQGRGVDNTRGSNGAINQSRNDGGPVASEQRRPPESESPPEREDSIGTPTTTTTTTTTTITPQLSDGGSVTSRMSPRHFSSSVADGDLDEVPLEDQTTRYPGST